MASYMLHHIAHHVAVFLLFDLFWFELEATWVQPQQAASSTTRPARWKSSRVEESNTKKTEAQNFVAFRGDDFCLGMSEIDALPGNSQKNSRSCEIHRESRHLSDPKWRNEVETWSSGFFFAHLCPSLPLRHTTYANSMVALSKGTK